MRLGIYGGSFDPIHWGHLLLAECCREQQGLDRVLFLPACQSPHKQEAAPVSAAARCEMVELAIAGHGPFELCTLEVDRGGLSYTIDTLRALREQYPHDQLFLLMGGDTLADFPRWKDPRQIAECCDLLVVDRPGGDPLDFESLAKIVAEPQLRQWASSVVQMPQIDLSSSEIRQRLADGRSIRFQVPRAVEAYLHHHQLYASRSDAERP